MVGCLGVKQPHGMIQEDLLTGLQHVRQDVGSGPQEIGVLILCLQPGIRKSMRQGKKGE